MSASLIILGSTGSIGRQTLVVTEKMTGWQVFGLAATGQNLALLASQICKFRPAIVAVTDIAAAQKLQQKFPRLRIFCGENSAEQLAREKATLVVNALAGVAGLPATLAALQTANDLALANKESLVMSGERVMQSAKKSGVRIYPLDSEHAALAQILRGVPTTAIARVILTASGGALRDWPRSKLKEATRRDVLAHPTWQMGELVTVHSATLANKAFEIIEAHHLFGLPYSKISAVIHPTSLVHALVELKDGSLLASLAEPDMRLPIQQALASVLTKIPQASLIKKLDLTRTPLEFRPIERARYPLFFRILMMAKNGQAAAAALVVEAAAKKFLAGTGSFGELTNST